MRVIVTGANGFIGTNLVKILSNKGAEVVAIVQDASMDVSFMAPYCSKILFSDVKKMDSLEQSLVSDKETVFVHLAWRGVNGTDKGVYSYQLDNIQMLCDAASFAKKIGCSKFVCAGTIAENAVYSLKDISETGKGFFYNTAKYCGRMFLETLCKNINLPFVWAELSNSYGPGNKTGNLVSYTLDKISKGEMASFGPANQLYDFIYIDDLMELFSRVIMNPTSKNFYHIGSGKPRLLCDYLTYIGKRTGHEDLIGIGKLPSDGIKYTSDMFDISSLVKDVGDIDTTSFEDGIEKTIANDANAVAGKFHSEGCNKTNQRVAIVTGADGFVGSHLIEELLKHDYEILAIDLSPTPRRLSPNKHIKYYQHSIEDIGFLSSINVFDHYDVWFHFAWRGSAGLERNDERIQLTNALQAADCLKEAAKIKCPKFVFAGSIMEFETNEVIYQQGGQPGLSYIYGAGKTIAHEIMKPIATNLGIALVWAYITNAYGVGESSPRFLNTTLRKLISNEDMQFTAGNQNYDFIYIDDVVSGFYLIGEKGIANKAYLIGSGHAKPLREFVIDVFKELAPSKTPHFGDVPYTGAMTPLDVYSIKEIQHDCGFIPKVSFSEGVRKTYNWLRSIDK
jgi:UDP-glucose 4-epimerase